jgi:integrase
MKGGIYSDERCPICGGIFRDNGNSLSCMNHPKCKAANHKVIFGKITKRFKSYLEAARFLTGLRFKTDENTFDDRDYRKNNPLGFSNLSSKWLQYRKNEVRPGSYKNLVSHIRYAQGHFEEMNVKEIRYGHIEDFLKTLTLSDKSKHNIISTLHSMFVWLKKRQEIRVMPEFPSVSFELKMRQTISKETQWQIMEEIKRICPNLKVYLAIKFLSTYISIRPGEMIRLKESDIDRDNGYLYFPHPKEKKSKSVPILKEDVEMLKSFPSSFPAMPFFRHISGVSGVAENDAFGVKYLYKWWVKACDNLNIKGVDLYGGTRHSSARALRTHRTPEEIKRATMHTTNKAFERYFQIEAEDVRNIYRDTVVTFPPDNIDKILTREKVT